MKMTQNRWQSKVLWTAIIAQALIIADVLGLWQAIGIERNALTVTLDALLQILVIVGIVNNPTDKENW